jgi:spore coat polysaccharide biosynthesis protein SpsF (cytidylyltransferase family)
MKTGVFIPVRLDSTRLPRKALLEIEGVPAIVHLIERLKLAKQIDEIVLCTSNESTDDELVQVAKSCEIKLCRGSKEDLLQRYHQAVIENDIDLIVNVDGDDILVDPEQVDLVAAELKKEGVDSVKCEGLPFGGAPVGVKAEALIRLCESKSDTDTATGWSRFFSDTSGYHVRTLVIDDPELNHPEIRMTLDYDEDYRFFKAVFHELYRPGDPVRLRDAIRVILKHPEIQSINAGLEERYWSHFNSQLPAGLKQTQ